MLTCLPSLVTDYFPFSICASYPYLLTCLLSSSPQFSLRTHDGCFTVATDHGADIGEVSYEEQYPAEPRAGIVATLTTIVLLPNQLIYYAAKFFSTIIFDKRKGSCKLVSVNVYHILYISAG